METATKRAVNDPDEPITEVTLVLKMLPTEFMAIRQRFLSGLAAQLRCETSDLQIMSIRHGCTKVTVRMTSGRAVETLKLANTTTPEAAEFRVEFGVRSAHFSEHIVLIRRGGREFTWMHISDIHFEDEAGPHAASQERVKKAFLDDLPEVLGADDLVPDAVFVTGDIAQRAQVNEYDKALDFLTRLKGILPKQSAPIMVVPGNHDVQRDWVAMHQVHEDAALKLLTTNDKIIDYLKSLKSKPERDSILARLDNFFAFSNKCAALGQPPLNHGYFYTTQLMHQGLNIGVAGLNSAWRCSSDLDRGRLILGVPQIDQALQDLAESDLRLLLLHHPIESEWFAREDQLYQRQHLGKFDFVLRGHEHDPHAVSLSQLHAAPTYRFAAGALYTHEEFPKSVNAVRINLDHGSARLFYWRLSPAKYEWVRDVDFHREGSVQFPLTDRTKSKISARNPLAAA